MLMKDRLAHTHRHAGHVVTTTIKNFATPVAVCAFVCLFIQLIRRLANTDIRSFRRTSLSIFIVTCWTKRN